MADTETLVQSLYRFAEQARHQPLTLGEAVDSLDESAYALVGIILVLPLMQPIPTGPFSVLGGLIFAALGWQLLRGNHTLRLPQKIRALALSEQSWRLLVKIFLKIIGFCHKFTQPRMQHLVSGRSGQKVGGSILLAAGFLMAIPFGVLPFNNALPGLAILFYCIGELEQDGWMAGIAFGWLLLTVMYFSAFFVALWHFGNEALQYFRSW